MKRSAALVKRASRPIVNDVKEMTPPWTKNPVWPADYPIKCIHHPYQRFLPSPCSWCLACQYRRQKHHHRLRPRWDNVRWNWCFSHSTFLANLTMANQKDVWQTTWWCSWARENGVANQCAAKSQTQATGNSYDAYLIGAIYDVAIAQFAWQQRRIESVLCENYHKQSPCCHHPSHYRQHQDVRSWWRASPPFPTSCQEHQWLRQHQHYPKCIIILQDNVNALQWLGSDTFDELLPPVLSRLQV